MRISDLATLRSLDPDLLHVFVAGPGVGECIAVALRGSGWIVVDGCQVAGESVPAAIIATYGRSEDEPVLAYLLTHPHTDHVKGVPQLLEARTPESVWVTARKPEGPHLLDVCRRVIAGTERAPTSDTLRDRPVMAAMKAICGWQVRTGRALGCAVDGERLRWRDREETVHIHAPIPSEHLDAILDEVGKGKFGRANHASMVLEIVDGATRIVLGGDLPRTQTDRTTVVPTGWDAVMERHPALAEHKLLKLAHHGSATAWHNQLMAPPSAHERAWAVTPFNNSGLPKIEVLDDLMSRQAPIHVTHPPTAWHIGRRNGCLVQRADISDRRTAEATGDGFADRATDIRPNPPDNALSPVWVFAFDRAGRLSEAWWGSTAIAVGPMGRGPGGGP